jgi:hypothetical protein
MSFFENVVPPIRDWLVELQTMGFQHIITCAKDGGAERNRTVATSPKIEYVEPEEYHPCVTKFYDGCTWPTQEFLGNRPPTIRACYPSLLHKKAQLKTRPGENVTLAGMRIKEPNGNLRYAGPLHLAQWLQHSPGWASKMSGTEEFQRCQKVVEFIKGRGKHQFEHLEAAHRPPDDAYDQCGVKVLCEECALVASRIGKGWAVKSMAKVFSEVLRKAVLDRLGVEVAEHFPFEKTEVHECGPTCNKKITQADAKVAYKLRPTFTKNRWTDQC